MEKCIKCNLNNPELYNCDSCKRPFCVNCSELTPDEIRCLSLRQRKLIFFCNDCESGLKQVPLLIREVSELKKELENLKQNLQQNRQTICSSDFQNNFENFEIICELEERQKCASNIIITNIKESSANNRQSRTEDEMKVVKEILGKTGTQVSDFQVHRLGKYQANKNRPIKVLMQNKHLAIQILKNSNKVGIPGVKIFNDQTKMQRNYYLSLKQKLEEYKRNGDDSKTIKYVNNVPKIVDKINNQKN